MTDLTLNEFRGLFDKELAQALEIERQKFLGSIVLEDNHKGKDIDIYCPPFFARCWFRINKHLQFRWKRPIRRCLCDQK